MIKKKAFLSWDLSDYQEAGLEPPESVKCGVTEGEAMEEEDIADWLAEILQTLSVLKNEYPNQYDEQFANYILDLEYLAAIGKITQEEKEDLSERENVDFG